MGNIWGMLSRGYSTKITDKHRISYVRDNLENEQRGMAAALLVFRLSF